MPNWTTNRIRIEGESAEIRKLLKAMKWEDELFDFNRLIPMPELLRNTGSGHSTIEGKKVEAWYIVERDEHGFEKKARLFTPEEEAELAKIGHPDWYSWSIQNWGTKWNACRVEVDDANVEYGYAEITFETAWCAPMPVLLKMRETFPTLRFHCEWRDEDESPYPHSLDDVA